MKLVQEHHRRLLPTTEGDIWYVPSSQTVLEKFVNITKQEPFGFHVSPVNPFIPFKENEFGVCIIIMYVDDMLIIGKKEHIQEFATKIQKEFSVKIEHNLTDYMGCEFHT